MAWSVAWNETTPAAGDDAKNGYARIQDVKIAVRERIAIEHDSEATTGSAKAWRHKFSQVASASARNAVTNTVDGWMCFRTDINAIQVKRLGATTGWDTYYGAFVGETKMYQGITSSIPPGWVISNGQIANGFQTADLGARFIVGSQPGLGSGDYDTTDPVSDQRKGGHTTHRVLKANIEAFDTTDSAVLSATTASPIFVGSSGIPVLSEATTGTITLGTASGSVTEIDHRPLYYALAFIVYVGLLETD